MSDFDEERLRDALQVAAARVSPEPPDVAAAQRVSTRRRRHARQAWSAGALGVTAALVGALLTVPGAHGRNSQVAPVAPTLGTSPDGSDRPPTTPSTSPATTSAAATGPGYYAVVSVDYLSDHLGRAGAIVLVSAETGQKVRELVPVDRSADFGQPVVSPSGRYVYFTKLPLTSAGDVIPGAGSAWRVPLAGGPAVHLPVQVDAGAYPTSVLPAPDDSAVVVGENTQQASTIGGVFNTVRVETVVDLTTSKSRTLPGGAAVAGWLPDGHRLVTYDSDTGTLNGPVVVRVFDLDSNKSIALATVGSGVPAGCNHGAAVVTAAGLIAVVTRLVDGSGCPGEGGVRVVYINAANGAVNYGAALPFNNYEVSPRVSVATDGSLVLHVYQEACYGNNAFSSTNEYRVDGAGVKTLTLNLPVCV